MDASTGKENANYAIKVLDEHLPLGRGHPLGRRAASALRARRHRAREERRRRRDQDGRGHAGRPRPRAVPRAVLERAPAGPGDPRHGRERERRSTRTILQAYFSRVYTADNLIVAAAGNIEHARLRELVERAFGGVPADGAARGRGARRSSTASCCVRTKDLEQSHVCMGVGAYRQNHQERYAALVFNTLLGGSMSSRLFQNVREKRGLAYSVGSGLSAFRDAGPAEHLRGLLEREGRRGGARHHGRAARGGRGAHRRGGARRARRTT